MLTGFEGVVVREAVCPCHMLWYARNHFLQCLWIACEMNQR